VLTMFHHVTTGIGAFMHWVQPSHHTIAMDIGVYGNIVLTVMGVLALNSKGLEDEAGVAAKKVTHVVSSPRKVR